MNEKVKGLGSSLLLAFTNIPYESGADLTPGMTPCNVMWIIIIIQFWKQQTED